MHEINAGFFCVNLRVCGADTIVSSYEKLILPPLLLTKTPNPRRLPWFNLKVPQVSLTVFSVFYLIVRPINPMSQYYFIDMALLMQISIWMCLSMETTKSNKSTRNAVKNSVTEGGSGGEIQTRWHATPSEESSTKKVCHKIVLENIIQLYKVMYHCINSILRYCEIH